MVRRDLKTGDIEFDQRLHALVSTGALDEAATQFLERHGTAIFAFLADRLRSPRDAEEVFAQFTEDFWRGLPRFGMRASMRSWAFTLARNAAFRHQRSPQRRPGYNQPLPEDSRLGPAGAGSRSQTPAYQRTTFKQQLRELRRRLPEADQTLLVLRLDQGLSWFELADVLSPEDAPYFPEVRNRRAAQLRQRFRRIKDRLRSWAERDGILPQPDSTRH